MAYLESIFLSNGQRCGFLETDSLVIWPVVPDDAPEALQALHGQRFPDLSAARTAIAAVLAEPPVSAPEPVPAVEPEPTPEPDPTPEPQSLNAETPKRPRR